jgi:hypothetical protein
MPIWLLGLLSGTRKLLLKAWEWFTDDPWRLFVIVAAVSAFLWWRADARADRLASELQALRDASAAIVKADKAADSKALDVAAQTKGTVDATNERAKAAANQSDDPLAAGFGELRKGASGGSSSTTR